MQFGHWSRRRLGVVLLLWLAGVPVATVALLVAMLWLQGQPTASGGYYVVLPATAVDVAVGAAGWAVVWCGPPAAILWVWRRRRASAGARPT